MLAKFRILMIALFVLVAVPETIFADDTAKISALEELLKQYMDENAELKKVIAEQVANEPDDGADVVVDEANAPAESADATVRLELYSSEIVCERALLNDKEYGLVVKMDAQKFADEAKRRGLDCSQAATQTCKLSPENCDETELCKMATYGSSVKVWYSGSGQVYVDAAQARGLNCGVEETAYIPTPVKTCEEDPKNCNADELCKKATYGSSVKVWYSGSGQVYVDAAQARGLNCGVKKGANDASAAVDVVEEATTSPDSASETERLELYTSEIICERSKLNDNEYGLVVKMDAQKYADEAERRGLNCADDIEDANTKVDKVCRSNLTDCSDEVLCELSTHNDGSVKWRSGLAASGGYIEFVNEAQRRGLDCGVENPASSTKASYTCENDPAYCDNSQLCEAAVTRIGGSVSWSSDPNRRFFVSEAKNRNISCGLTYPLASCAGWNGTVAKIEGVDTENAVMSGYVMEKDFREYCTRDPGGETTTFGGELSIDQCVSKYFSVNKEQVVTFANCNTGELVNEWFLAGVKKTSKETFPLGIGTDRSCASGLLPLEAQFSMLCPSNANSDDWIAAGQQRKADAENLTSDAEEQKRLADEKQKADADAKTAEQKQLADEEKKKADADAKSAETENTVQEDKPTPSKILSSAEATERNANIKKRWDKENSVPEFQRGLVEYNKGNFKSALEVWLPLSEQGHVIATHNLGIMYQDGVGVLQDKYEALKFFKIAAEQGLALSQTILGLFYEKGIAVSQSTSEALKWYRLAAEQGEVQAQFNLAVMNDLGVLVPLNQVEALMWYNIAASNGVEKAAFLRDDLANRMNASGPKIGKLGEVDKALALAKECLASIYQNCAWENSPKTEAQVQPDLKSVNYTVLNLTEYTDAVFLGSFNDGKSYEEYIFEMQANPNIKIMDAFINSKSMANGVAIIGIGENEDLFYCLQKTKEAKDVYLNLPNNKFWDATVYGYYKSLSNGIVMLDNCLIER